jgi:hypothetical protein
MGEKKNPELTVCQLHTAMAALVRSWWISEPKDVEKQLEKAAAKIRYAQRRNAQARESHTKTTLKKLEILGIDLAKVKRCQWDET